MREEILRLINIFGSGLSESKYNQYIPKLRDYLLEYLIFQKSNISVERLFMYEFTIQDIIQSTEYYIMKNDNVKSKAAIDDYLGSINRFFVETIFKKYPNHNLISVKPFTNLSKEIELYLISKGLELTEKQANPAINEDQYILINKLLNNESDKTFKTMQVSIIIKLILLYGFSFDRISNLNLINYSNERRTLEVYYSSNPLRSLLLELPFSLNQELGVYTDMHKQMGYMNNRLFINTKGKSIKHDFTIDFLQIARDEYHMVHEEDRDLRNAFTQTGLAKFGIMKMILDGVNQSVISDLTGFGSDVMKDCQDEVNANKELKRNRYINHMIRGISTFDDF